MPRPNSLEVHRKAGTKLVFRRTDIAAQPFLDLGVLNAPPSPQNTVNRLDSYDERGGARVLDETGVTEYLERFTVQLRNQQMDMLALYLAAATPAAFSQTNTAVTNQSYTSKKGAELPIVAPTGHPDAGDRVYNLSAVEVTNTAGDTTYVAGTDYIVDARKGMIFIPTTSAIPDGAIHIDYTPGTITAGQQVNPQTLIQGVPGELEEWKVAESGAKQRVRYYPSVRISSTGGRQEGVAQDNYLELQVDVLADPLAAQPAGYVREIPAP